MRIFLLRYLSSPMRIEVLLILLAAHLVIAGEFCGQAEVLNIVVVDFWGRSVEFHYYISSKAGIKVGKGVELVFRLPSADNYVVYIPRPLERGGVYMAAADWREVAVYLRNGAVCVSGSDAHQLEDGVLTVYVYGDGVTYQEVAAAAVAIPTLLAVMYLVERRYKKLHGWILKRLALSSLNRRGSRRRPRGSTPRLHAPL